MTILDYGLMVVSASSPFGLPPIWPIWPRLLVEMAFSALPLKLKLGVHFVYLFFWFASPASLSSPCLASSPIGTRISTRLVNIIQM